MAAAHGRDHDARHLRHQRGGAARCPGPPAHRSCWRRRAHCPAFAEGSDLTGVNGTTSWSGCGVPSGRRRCSPATFRGGTSHRRRHVRRRNCSSADCKRPAGRPCQTTGSRFLPADLQPSRRPPVWHELEIQRSIPPMRVALLQPVSLGLVDLARASAATKRDACKGWHRIGIGIWRAPLLQLKKHCEPQGR
jgi:hypothetical protein